ncbi:hypothetical protein [Enterobacter phage vB_ExiM_F5M1E]|nr:hypothetical protein [Enterobacter phage vB_ExiM_F1M1E]UNA03113.1 hypothetical protein [Enterobacter phage vB_ExiM_F2M1E]UNA03434.1 hypothetical protein [Enterobacter phage vB_ExiM_F4M1E]UNA03755.1 hypothetical protein [Enterobacter phage vB_ExiM_F5M1E]UNA04075.1 hypothetical protein [Pantoea phage vB_PdiM_F5M2A]
MRPPLRCTGPPVYVLMQIKPIFMQMRIIRICACRH